MTWWVERINDRHKEPDDSDLCNRLRSDRPIPAHNSVSIDQADSLIKKNRHITIYNLGESLRVSASSAAKIVDYLGYPKI